MTTPLSRLREVVREALALGDSQAALAKRLGVTQPTISGWLTEDGLDPKASVLEAVARVLGYNGHWLLTGKGDRRNIETGGDAVYAAGRRAGRFDALQVCEKLVATSPGLDGADVRLAQLGEQVHLPQRAARPKRRPSRGA